MEILDESIAMVNDIDYISNAAMFETFHNATLVNPTYNMAIANSYCAAARRAYLDANVLMFTTPWSIIALRNTMDIIRQAFSVTLYRIDITDEILSMVIQTDVLILTECRFITTGSAIHHLGAVRHLVLYDCIHLSSINFGQSIMTMYIKNCKSLCRIGNVDPSVKAFPQIKHLQINACQHVKVTTAMHTLETLMIVFNKHIMPLHFAASAKKVMLDDISGAPTKIDLRVFSKTTKCILRGHINEK